MLTEGNRDALGVVLFYVLHGWPEDKARETFEIPEFFECDWSVPRAANMRWLGSRFACRELRRPSRRFAIMIKQSARTEGAEKCREDDGDR
jgi:hypothetical protein